ncbi:GPI mannosyltransferase 4 [Achlya hypogyna]|uniref:Mannosyltransferase n=1 Tax=Achlya hypogyna TaxID=1202772 RepID=A0A1V9Z009_ACHHY|nr:GPI mannosyltransferase 4 [Achlya hypogyna]
MTTWTMLYVGAVLLRVACIFSMGMVHPDEFFQCPEVMAGAVYNASNVFIPWEYQPAAPNRSILFPSIVAGIPYAIAKALGVAPSGLLFLLVPRAILTALTFSFDFAIYKLAHAFGVDFRAPLLTFATSWTTLVLLTRSFSNAFEAWLAMLSFAVLHTIQPAAYAGVFSKKTLLLGVLLALGSFTRFTFILFFLPVGVALVLENDAALCTVLAKKSDGSAPSWPRRLLGVLETALGGAFAFGVTATACVLADTWYFRGPAALSNAPEWVVAPVNNMLYNLDPAHLAEHGIHPRTNHWCLNMQMLFGPLPALALYHGRRRAGLLLAAVVVPVTLLSLAPHQEARFLLPVVFPLMLLAGPSMAASKLLQAVWVVFNAALVLWFGVLHQGGLVPLLLSATPGAPTPLCTNVSLANVHTILITGTYMPPRFALSPENITVVDERLENMHGPIKALLDTLPQTPGRTGIAFVFPAPWRADVEAVVAQHPGLALDEDSAGACGPFLSVESLPPDVLDVTQWSLRVQHVVRLTP